MTVEEFRNKIHQALDEEMQEINKAVDSGKPLSNFDQGRCFEMGAVEGLMSKIISDSKNAILKGSFND